MKDAEIQAIRSTVTARPVRYAAIFGSRARGDNSKSSDYDLLIDYKPGYRYSLLDIADIKLDLQEKLHHDVDVVTVSSARPKLLKLIEPELQVIYDDNR